VILISTATAGLSHPEGAGRKRQTPGATSSSWSETLSGEPEITAAANALGRRQYGGVNALKIYKCFHKSDHPEMQIVITDHEALLREIDLKL
jgi:hypothetical protein